MPTATKGPRTETDYSLLSWFGVRAAGMVGGYAQWREIQTLTQTKTKPAAMTINQDRDKSEDLSKC
jgi:hypothetical protein